jgi:outer membrane protein assembly factor BamB
VVYFGSGNNANGGETYALNAKTGALLWSYVTEIGGASSPAISKGVVYFGNSFQDDACDTPNVIAVKASTGKALWSDALCNYMNAPAVADDVVYVGTDQPFYQYTLYALNARTGAQLWTFSDAGGDSTPAVANGVVYVGTSDFEGCPNNNIYALNGKTGAQLWSYKTGGCVASSPAVVDGVVYAGSDDGYVYAFGLK